MLSTARPWSKGAAHGGGMGGYARMALVLLRTTRSIPFRIKPCYHTSRKRGPWWPLLLPLRLAYDAAFFAWCSRGSDAVHITLQYRNAIVREAVLCFIARVRGLPILVDIRAGAFRKWYSSGGVIARSLGRFVIQSGKMITVEGKPDATFLEEQFGRPGTYLPNFVPSDEIPSRIPDRCTNKTLRVLFVGYCYEGKGVYELVRGCRIAAGRGVSLSLTFAGAEDPSFAAWLDREAGGGLPFELHRKGLTQDAHLKHLYESADVFCMPSRHPGEGHSNALNEAMMWGLVILCSRHGFFESILDESACYFLQEDLAESIARELIRVDSDRDEARRRAGHAHQILVNQFSSTHVIPRLESIYERLLAAK